MIRRCKLFGEDAAPGKKLKGAASNSVMAITSDPNASAAASEIGSNIAFTGTAGGLSSSLTSGSSSYNAAGATNFGVHKAIWDKAGSETRSLDRNAYNPNTRANSKVSTMDAISSDLNKAVDSSVGDLVQPVNETMLNVKVGMMAGTGAAAGGNIAKSMGKDVSTGRMIGGMGGSILGPSLFSQFSDDAQSSPAVRLAANTVTGTAGAVAGGATGVILGTGAGMYLGHEFSGGAGVLGKGKAIGKGGLIGAGVGLVAGGHLGGNAGSKTFSSQKSFSIMSIGQEAGRFGKSIGQFAWNHRKRLAKDAVIMGGLFTAGNYLTNKLISKDAKKIGLMPNLNPNPNPLLKQYTIPGSIKKIGDKVWKYTGLMIKENPKESIAGLAFGGMGGIGYLAQRHQYMKTKNSVMQLPASQLRLYSAVGNGIKCVGKGIGAVLNGIKGFIYDPKTGKKLSDEFALIGSKNNSKWASKVGNWIGNHKVAVGVAGAAAPMVSFTLGERASNVAVRKPLEKLDKNAFEYEKYQTNLIN